MKKNEPSIVGAFEKVDFPEFGIHGITAKIDTGAYSGALHCTKIHEEEQGDEIVLHFSPFDHPEVVMTSHNFYIKPVTSSNGETADRYFIDTDITVAGRTYPILISLADRSELRWPVLIGRRFLRINNLLVDATKNNT